MFFSGTHILVYVIYSTPMLLFRNSGPCAGLEGNPEEPRVEGKKEEVEPVAAKTVEEVVED